MFGQKIEQARKNVGRTADLTKCITNYNLSVSTYAEQEDTCEIVDIIALNAEIERIVAREDGLRREINAIIAEIEGGGDDD